MFLQNLHTVFIISVGTYYLLTIIVLKFEIVHYITWLCVWNTAVCKANSMGPGRTPSFAASDLGLRCLQRSVFDIMALSLPVVVSKTD